MYIMYEKYINEMRIKQMQFACTAQRIQQISKDIEIATLLHKSATDDSIAVTNYGTLTSINGRLVLQNVALSTNFIKTNKN